MSQTRTHDPAAQLALTHRGSSDIKLEKSSCLTVPLATELAHLMVPRAVVVEGRVINSWRETGAVKAQRQGYKM